MSVHSCTCHERHQYHIGTAHPAHSTITGFRGLCLANSSHSHPIQPPSQASAASARHVSLTLIPSSPSHHRLRAPPFGTSLLLSYHSSRHQKLQGPPFDTLLMPSSHSTCHHRLQGSGRSPHMRGEGQDLEKQEDRARPQALSHHPHIPPPHGVHEPAVQLRPIFRPELHVLVARHPPWLREAFAAPCAAFSSLSELRLLCEFVRRRASCDVALDGLVATRARARMDTCTAPSCAKSPFAREKLIEYSPARALQTLPGGVRTTARTMA